MIILENGQISKRAIDISGSRYGKLIALFPVKRDGRHRQIVWRWKCDCGNEFDATSTEIKSGHASSCGCRSGGLKDEAPFNQLYAIYVTNANKRKIEFSLSKFEFKYLTSGDCYYCGESPSTYKYQKQKKTSYLYNGIDRVNNSIGYVVYNCVPCCRKCNTAKMAMGVEEFISWVHRVYTNLNSWMCEVPRGVC